MLSLALTLSGPALARLLDLRGRTPAYAALRDGIRMLVVDGRLGDGTRLPSERELAVALGVSRTTTARAYDELRALGLIRSRQGSGSVVVVPAGHSSRSGLLHVPEDPGAISMIYSAFGQPFGLGGAFERAAQSLPGLLATTGYLPDGLPRLREALAARYDARGIPTDPAQIVVTNGAMGAISLVARTLVRTGDRVLAEPVSYPQGVQAFAAAGARIVALPLSASESGRPWDGLAQVAGAGRLTAAYLVPDFHNPTGLVMTSAERTTTAAALRRSGVVPVVDESLREVDLAGVGVPESFAEHDPEAFLLGSASKSYWGGLRVGWVRAPRRWVDPLLRTRMVDDLGTSAFDQVVFAELLEDGGAALRAGNERAREARDHLVGALAQRLPGFTCRVPDGGLNLWLTLPERRSSALVEVAADHGLVLTPGSRFFIGSPAVGEGHLRLPFTHPHDVLDTAVDRLSAAWQRLEERPDGVRRPREGSRIDLIA